MSLKIAICNTLNYVSQNNAVFILAKYCHTMYMQKHAKRRKILPYDFIGAIDVVVVGDTSVSTTVDEVVRLYYPHVWQF